MNKKKLFLIFSGLFLGLALFIWFKPLIDINKVGFSEVPTATPVAQRPVLKFSVIGDPESDLPNLKKALEISKRRGSEFVVLVGDLTQVGSKIQLEQIKEVLNYSGLKYYVVPGNHDLYASRKQTKDPKKYFREVFGKPYYSLLINKISFLFLDNSDDQKLMENEQIEFIKSNLNKFGKNLNFIFFHMPVYHPTSDYIMGYQNNEISKQKDELLDILKNASVSAIFAGHLHKTASYEWEGIKMYVAGSVNSTRNWQTPRFLEVEVFENKEFKVSEIEL